jgi:nucleotide-binding universal stress UspA family protein
MIRSILLAVDASENAKVATSYAIFLARALDAVLDVVYVMDTRLINTPYWTDYGAISLPVTRFSDEMRQVLESQGKRVLEGVLERTQEAGLRCRTEVRTGIPALEIMDAAKDCDLIVLGRYGESSMLEERKSLGAVAERVLRSATQPVFVASDVFTQPRRIVLGFDGSDRAREAMTYATELSGRLKVPLVALSVHADEAVASQRLDVVRNYADAHGLEVSTQVLEGDAAEAILASASEGDLIAMGAFGEGRIREWLLGSTTEAVLRGARQPVLMHR